MTMTTICRTSVNYAASSGALVGGPVEIEIRDGREAQLPGWETCGFELVDHRSTVDNWVDDAGIAAAHYGEIEEVARALTGCDAALVSDHVRRTASTQRRTREQTPVHLVHSDFAADYADVIRHAYDDVRGRGAETLARTGMTPSDIHGAQRLVMMQFWRNTGPRRMDQPLAFCDSRTVTPEETRPFLYTGYVAGGRSFNALAVMAPDDPRTHHWYSFPDMAADEVAAFRTFDSELVARNTTWFTPHTSFRDPSAPPDRPPRESVELRVLCLWL